MRQEIKKLLKGAACFLGCMLAGVAGMAADVDVYAEGAISGARLTVYIYADLNIDTLLSYGVSLNYDAEELNLLDVQQRPDPVPYTGNPAKCHPGERTEAYHHHLELEYAYPGEIIVLGGSEDRENPAHCFPQGSRALLAVVTFGPANIELASNPILFLSYARGEGLSGAGHFLHMETVPSQETGGIEVSFGTVSVAEQGDADRDGRVTFKDIDFIESNLDNVNAPCYVDCDGDGRISLRDINCVESKL